MIAVFWPSFAIEAGGAALILAVLGVNWWGSRGVAGAGDVAPGKPI